MIDLSYAKHQPTRYTDKQGNEAKFILEIPDWVLEHIAHVVDYVPDPVQGRKEAEILINAFIIAFTKGLTAQADNPGLELTEAMAMFTEEVDPEGPGKAQ